MSSATAPRRYARPAPMTENVALKMARGDKSISWGLTLVEEQWKVHTVKPNSVAERCGLRKDDTILSVNSVPTSSPLVREIMMQQLTITLQVERPMQVTMAPPMPTANPVAAAMPMSTFARPPTPYVSIPSTGNVGPVASPRPAAPNDSVSVPANFAPASSPRPTPNAALMETARINNLIADETFQRTKMSNAETQARTGMSAEFKIKPKPSLSTVLLAKRAEVDEKLRKIRQKREAETQMVKSWTVLAFGGESSYGSLMSYIRAQKKHKGEGTVNPVVTANE